MYIQIRHTYYMTSVGGTGIANINIHKGREADYVPVSYSVLSGTVRTYT